MFQLEKERLGIGINFYHTGKGREGGTIKERGCLLSLDAGRVKGKRGFNEQINTPEAERDILPLVPARQRGKG